MGFKLFLASLITLIFYLYNKVGFKLKVFMHPIVITPLFGLLLGREAFVTGITLGVIVELIFGSNMLDYEEGGLKYVLLVGPLALSLVMLTSNISLFLNLALVILLVFAFGEVFSLFEDKKFFIYGIFTFNFLVLLGDGLIGELLGWIPAQFLEELSIGGGSLVALVGLAIFLIQATVPKLERDNIWYYSYGIATIVTSFILFKGQSWAIILFPITWHLLYYIWEKEGELLFREYLRTLLSLLVILATPYIIELNVISIDGWIDNLLWSQALLASVAILRLFKLTAIEGYFIMTLFGIVGARLGWLI